MSDKSHWEKIYTTKGIDQVCWFQTRPAESLDLIRRTGIAKTMHIIDVGAGASTLVDYLLDDHFEQITALDISPTALDTAKARLGLRAEQVTWVETDITQCALPVAHYDLWHDRAVFHFLMAAEDRRKYVEAVRRSLKPGGHIIIASFAPDGPAQCSGLDVMRYSPHSLHNEFGDDFEFLDSRRENHLTPFGTQQNFIYCYCRKR
ncbi:MAG: class I SAM-dependent methyltransferase [Aggregatilineales bacterium]